MTEPSYVTVECSHPGARYTLFESGPSLIVHLAGPGKTGGTGPCICGFDRFDPKIGFSVGGGVSGPSTLHEVCADCLRLGRGGTIRGIHAGLFAVTDEQVA